MLIVIVDLIENSFLLVPKSVVDLMNTLLSEISSIDSLGIIIRDACIFGSLGDRVAAHMN